MGHVVGQIGLGRFGRAHAAEIAGDLGIKMQLHQIRQMILAKFLG